MPRVDRQEVAAIFAGGMLGALLRASLEQWAGAPAGTWPWVTFLVNLGGTFALGYLVTRLQERLPLSAYRRPLLGTGFCGALTTFSTMQLELLKMVDAGRTDLALAYAGAGVTGGLVAVALGTALARRVRVVA
jgi:fluoride exporter